ncbi:Uncharacterised protein [Mycobacterium tuberculosis]|nr:Uncharacterised protein [Mycobacterium tuberculosis]
MAAPCPPRYLVAECTTMSAPWANGWIRYGVAMVLSTINGTPLRWATSETAGVSSRSICGLEMVSAKNALVLGRTAACQVSRSSGSSTKLTSMPSLASE